MYDIRALKPLPPLPFASGPAFINVIPKRSSILAITSHQGLVNIVDASNPTVNEFYQVIFIWKGRVVIDNSAPARLPFLYHRNGGFTHRSLFSLR